MSSNCEKPSVRVSLLENGGSLDDGIVCVRVRSGQKPCETVKAERDRQKLLGHIQLSYCLTDLVLNACEIFSCSDGSP